MNERMNQGSSQRVTPAAEPPSKEASRSSAGRELRQLIADDAWVDDLLDRADQGGVSLTGVERRAG